MGQVGDGTVIAPFANEAMRLLREDWKGKYGSKMLAEELFPILQTNFPQPDQTFQNNVTIYAGQNDAFMQFIDKFGNVLYNIDGPSGLKPVETPGYPPPKLRPRIVWGPHTITAGGSISGTELDAVAVDPETGVEVPGVYVYTPPDGTTFSSAGTATLYVNFTPTDGVKYRRSMGSTVLTITGSAVKLDPDVSWPTPDDIWLGTALSGTQLNAAATDPVTHASIPGVYVYAPPSGTVLVNEPLLAQDLQVTFFPTDTATYNTAGPFDNAVFVNGIYGLTPSSSGGDRTYTTEAGDVIVIGVQISDSSSGATVTVTDTQGNTYTQIGSYERVDNGAGSFLSASLWYAVVGGSGTATVGAASITPSGGSSPTVIAFAVNGYRGVLSLDSSSQGSGASGSTYSAGTCSVALDREVIVVFLAGDGVNAVPGHVVTGWGFDASFGVGNLLTNAVGFHANGISPRGGVSASTAVITGGVSTGLWAAISASFKHRTS